jgi:cysteine desulfurase
VSVSFKGIRSEVLVHALEEKEIYVSSGSACSSHSKKESSTLKSIGMSRELMDGTIRVSIGRYNTIEDANLFLSEIERLIPVLSMRRK